MMKVLKGGEGEWRMKEVKRERERRSETKSRRGDKSMKWERGREDVIKKVRKKKIQVQKK